MTCACVAKKISVFFLLGRFSKSPPRLAAAALLSSRTFMVSGIYSSDFGGRDAAYLMTHVLLFLFHFLIVHCSPLVALMFQEAAPLISRSISFRPSRLSTFFFLLIRFCSWSCAVSRPSGRKSGEQSQCQSDCFLLPPGEAVMCHPGGQCDAAWPFMQVLLCLFNEMPASSHHVETILPDVHAKTDQRLQLVQIKVVEIISKIP